MRRNLRLGAWAGFTAALLAGLMVLRGVFAPAEQPVATPEQAGEATASEFPWSRALPIQAADAASVSSLVAVPQAQWQDRGVCGLPSADTSTEPSEVDNQRPWADTPQARQVLQQGLAALAARSDLHQLAAWTMQAAQQAERDFNETAPACRTDDTRCRDGIGRWKARREAAYAAIAEPALAVAERNGSPAATLLVLQICQAAESAAPAGCAQGLLQRWAQQEPDNAAPWLLLAAEAQSRGQPQAAQNARYRASQARQLDDHSQRLNALLSAAEFGPEAGWSGAQLQSLWFAAKSGVELAVPSTLRDMCSAQALQDSNRAQTCDTLARLMADDGRTLLTRLVGKRYGERLGWPAERLRQLDDQSAALQQLMNGAQTLPIDPSDAFSCAALKRRQVRAQAMAELGEVGYFEAQMREQGQSPQVLAREHRDRAEQHAQAAQAAASAASQSSAP